MANPKPYFAVLAETPEGRAKLKLITARGGLTTWKRGKAHKFKKGKEARENGSIGGQIRAVRAESRKHK